VPPPRGAGIVPGIVPARFGVESAAVLRGESIFCGRLDPPFQGGIGIMTRTHAEAVGYWEAQPIRGFALPSPSIGADGDWNL
jgi:hypothetical protein